MARITKPEIKRCYLRIQVVMCRLEKHMPKERRQRGVGAVGAVVLTAALGVCEKFELAKEDLPKSSGLAPGALHPPVRALGFVASGSEYPRPRPEKYPLRPKAPCRHHSGTTERKLSPLES